MLGARLRDMRKGAGLSGRALAVRTGQHYTRVSKIENGVQTPTETDIRTWCKACGDESDVADLLASLRSARTAYAEHQRVARAGMRQLSDPRLEARYTESTSMRIYEHNVIPGLFQTAEYTSAMLSFWIDFLGTPNDLESALALRMQRQQVLYRPDKRFAVVLEEQALRTFFATAGVQAGQLDRLLAVMSLPNVSLGIIPMLTERAAVGSAGFWIFDNSLVALDTPTAGIEVTRPSEIRLYARMFELLRGSAVYGADARELIVRTLDELAEPDG